MNENKKRTFLQHRLSVISSPMRDSPDDPLAFEPVPSASSRQDGWTPERQRAFIAALAEIGMVSAAARAVGMSRKSAYALLNRAGPESGFARAWRAAQSRGEALADGTAIARAIHGVEEPYFYRGLQRGTRRVYNDRLLIAALNAADRRAGAGCSAGAGNGEPRARFVAIFRRRTVTFVTFAPGRSRARGVSSGNVRA
jgi:hypothetical protein